MEDHLLSFELNEDQQRLEIHGDQEGFEILIRTLQKLLANTKDGHTNHDHLMTPAWSGWELSEANKGGGIVLNHVKVYCHKDT